MESKHKTLYKYVDVETFLKMFTYDNYLDASVVNTWHKVLRKNPTIKFSKVNQFRTNDFIDTLPIFEDQNSRAKFLKEANSIIQKLKALKTINKERLNTNLKEPWDIYNRIIEIYTETMIMDRFSSDPTKYSSKEVLNIIDNSNLRPLFELFLNNTEGKALNFRNEFSNYFGVFCLTNNEFNTAMWSHYSCNDGFVIGYDMQHEFFNDDTFKLLEMDYDEKRPKVTSKNLLRHAINDFDLSHPVFHTKHENWDYENEFRLVKRINKKQDRILELPIETIKEINIGFINYPLDDEKFEGKKFRSVYDPDEHEKDYKRVENFMERIRINDFKKIELTLNRWLENLDKENYGTINRMLPYGKKGYKKIPISKHGVNIQY